MKLGDGAADVKPIAHLYKSQVYQLAGVPRRARRNPPAQADDRYLSARTIAGRVLLRPLAGTDRPVHLRARSRYSRQRKRRRSVGLTAEQVARAFDVIDSKREAARATFMRTRPARMSGGPRMTWTRLKERVAALADTPGLLLAQKLLRRVPFRPVDIGQLCFLQLNGVPDVPPSMVRGARGGEVRNHARPRRPSPAFRTRHRFFASASPKVTAALWRSSMTGSSATNGSPTAPSTTRPRGATTITIPGGFVYAYDAYIDPLVPQHRPVAALQGVSRGVDGRPRQARCAHLRRLRQLAVAANAPALRIRADRERRRRARDRPAAVPQSARDWRGDVVASSHGWRCIRRRCTCITPRERSTSPWRSSAGNQALGGAGARSSRMRSWARRCQSSNRDGP